MIVAGDGLGVEAPGETGAAVVVFAQFVLLDHRAHAAVQQQDALAQSGFEPGDAPGREPRLQLREVRGGARRRRRADGIGLGAHGLVPISEMTSKCGGRFSRVTVSEAVIVSPAFSTNLRSSLSLKPRLTWL